ARKAADTKIWTVAVVVALNEAYCSQRVLHKICAVLPPTELSERAVHDAWCACTSGQSRIVRASSCCFDLDDNRQRLLFSSRELSGDRDLGKRARRQRLGKSGFGFCSRADGATG